MKISMWHNNKDIRIEEVPVPEPGDDEMVVRVMSCGICGSDICEWYRLPRAPLVQGHEIGGDVVKTGKNVTQYAPGDRVFVAPKVPCMTCRYCREGHYPVCPNVKDRLPGGFAQYILVPAALVSQGTYRLPPALSYDQSTFIEPLACVVRAQRLSGVREGKVVMVMGCGMSGLLHVKLAKARNATVIAVDINDNRLAFAERIGADMVINATGPVPEKLLETIERKVDVIILCTAAMSAISQAWQCIDKGGTIVFFAVPDPDKQVTVPINAFWMQEISIITSYYCGPPDLTEAMGLLADGDVVTDDMITHRLPLTDIQRGFDLVLAANDSIKVIVTPHTEP